MDREQSSGSSNSSWMSFDFSDEERISSPPPPNPAGPPTRDIAIQVTDRQTRPTTREIGIQVTGQDFTRPTRPTTRDVGIQVTECNPLRCVEICNLLFHAFESRFNQIEAENHLQQEEIQYGLRQENDETPTLAMNGQDFVANMLTRVMAIWREIFRTEGLQGMDNN